jgi:predicted chitinase
MECCLQERVDLLEQRLAEAGERHKKLRSMYIAAIGKKSREVDRLRRNLVFVAEQMEGMAMGARVALKVMP